MINVLVCGINGKMGKSITELIAAEKDMQIVCGIDLRADKSALPPYMPRLTLFARRLT